MTTKQVQIIGIMVGTTMMVIGLEMIIYAAVRCIKQSKREA